METAMLGCRDAELLADRRMKSEPSLQPTATPCAPAMSPLLTDNAKRSWFPHAVTVDGVLREKLSSMTVVLSVFLAP